MVCVVFPTFADLVATIDALPLRVPGAWLSCETSRPDTTVRVWRSDPSERGFTVLLLAPDGPRSLLHAPGTAVDAAELVMAYALVPPLLASSCPAAVLDHESWAWRHADPVLVTRWVHAGIWDADVAQMADSLGLSPESLQPVLPPGTPQDQLRALNLTWALKEAEADAPA